MLSEAKQSSVALSQSPMSRKHATKRLSSYDHLNKQDGNFLCVPAAVKAQDVKKKVRTDQRRKSIEAYRLRKKLFLKA